MTQEWRVLNKSIKDFFSAPVLKLALLPFIISSFLLFGLFIGVADQGLSMLENASMQYEQESRVVENGQVVQEESVRIDETGPGIVDAIVKSTAGAWALSFLVYGLGSVVVGMVSIYTALIIVGFLTPWIIRAVHRRGWSHLPLRGYGTLLGSVATLIKQSGVMVLLFIVLIPLYFIPLVNLVAFNAPLFYFFHRMLHYDVSSEMMTKEQFAVMTMRYKNRLRFRSLGLYLVSMLPFVWLVIPVFYIVYLANGYFDALDKEQPKTDA